MAKELSFTIQGLDAVSTIFKRAKDPGRVMPLTASLLKNFADTKITGPAKEKYVPVATGNLKSTIRTEGPVIQNDQTYVDVVAGGPAAKYAARVHENPRAGKTGGVSPSGKPYPRTRGGKPTWATTGQWKYIETPMIKAVGSSQTWLKNEAVALLNDLFRKH